VNGCFAGMRSRLRFFPSLSLVLVAAGAAIAQVPSPTIEGPITGPGAPFVQVTSFDLAQVGYVQEEYFLSGTARAFTNTGPLGVDGKWSVVPATSAAYKTRIVVHRPTNRRAFNGTVVVEWLNVSGGVEAGPDWTLAHTELIRKGYAWVGVSAQVVGVEGGPALVGVVSLPLKSVNPARYGTLHHPGDSFSYDIFSQVGQAIREPSGPDPLADLPVKRVIAAGESQSAFRLVTYIDAIHPSAHVFDGYFVHSRGSFGAGLSEAPQPTISVPGTAAIRDDIDVPVLTLETESDLTFLNYFAARQDDGKNFRLWEVAGTAHADSYITVSGPTDLGHSPAVVGLVAPTSPLPGVIDCGVPINSGPHHFVVKAAIAALDKWVRRGKAPRPAPRLDVMAGPPPTIARDANGVALGGIRTPQVDVPIAAFSGTQPGSILCMLFGETRAFDAATLASLYPSHRAFVSAYGKAVSRADRAGWILPPDARLMRRWAAASDIGG
jgi:Alpha/beta hydrolase domain